MSGIKFFEILYGSEQFLRMGQRSVAKLEELIAPARSA